MVRYPRLIGGVSVLGAGACFWVLSIPILLVDAGLCGLAVVLGFSTFRLTLVFLRLFYVVFMVICLISGLKYTFQCGFVFD